MRVDAAHRVLAGVRHPQGPGARRDRQWVCEPTAVVEVTVPGGWILLTRSSSVLATQTEPAAAARAVGSSPTET